MTEIKNASTIILVRHLGAKKYILMGKRSSKASFMPGKYVFPGGGWEKSDRDVPVVQSMDIQQKRLLMMQTSFTHSHRLGITAVRELWEETGLRLSSRGIFSKYPGSWKDFFLDHQGPNLRNLKFFFRAVTPPGRSRRFDARFFFCDAKHIYDDLDNFDKASGELINLKWVTISHARCLALPKITQVVIEHLISVIKSTTDEVRIPFYSGGVDGMNKQYLEI